LGQFWYYISLFKFVKICFTIFFLSTFSSSAVIPTTKRRSVLNFSTFPKFLIVTRRPGHSSSSTVCVLAEHLLCHSDTGAAVKVFSPHASRDQLNVPVAVSFSFTRNLMLDLCLIYQPGSRQVKKSFIKIITGHFTNLTGRGLA